MDERGGWSPRSWLASRLWCEEHPTLTAHQILANVQQRRCAPPRTAENQQLVLEEEILSDHSPSTTGLEALGDRGQKVGDKNQYRLHSREDQGNGGDGRKIV